MADIQNLKIGNVTPNALMLDKYYISPGKFNFNDWEINTDCEVEIDKIGKVAKIKKFKANTWVLRSKYEGMDNIKFCELFSNWTCKILNINRLVTEGIISGYSHDTWGGPKYTAWGLSFSPYDPSSWAYIISYPWELNVPNGTLKNPNRGALSYGYTADGKNNLFNLTKFNTLSSVGTAYQGAFSIYTKTDDVAGTIIDVSDYPITIYQYSDGIDVTSVECWSALFNNEEVYHKDKTFENCWKQYNFVKKETTQIGDIEMISIINNNTEIDTDDGIILPLITNLNDVIKKTDVNGKTLSMLNWNIKIKNVDLWSVILDWYKNNTVPYQFVGTFSSLAFKDSNITGELTLNIDDSNEGLSEDNDGPLYMSAIDFLKGTDITKVTFNLSERNRFTIGQNMFRNATKVISVETNKPISSVDCSGMFEFCNSLTTYGSNLINWGARGNFNSSNGTSNVCYCFEYTSSLLEIPSYDQENRFSDSNTIICTSFTPQLFNGSRVEVVGPIIDVRYINPMIKGNAKLMFADSHITDIRIKNLNHATWYLDGSGQGDNNHGNMPNLNSESIQYLFDNLIDLNTHEEGKGVITLTNSFSLWDGITNNNNEDPVTLEQVGFKYFTSCRLGKRFKTGENANTPCHTNKQFNGLKITVSGLIEGDRLEFGEGVVNKSDQSILSNGSYTIDKNDDLDKGFKLYRDAEELPQADYQQVMIYIDNPVDEANPMNSTAEIHCPENWRSSINSEMIQTANARGWTILINNEVIQ